jgi:hypothetical protein
VNPKARRGVLPYCVGTAFFIFEGNTESLDYVYSLLIIAGLSVARTGFWGIFKTIAQQ